MTRGHSLRTEGEECPHQVRPGLEGSSSSSGRTPGRSLRSLGRPGPWPRSTWTPSFSARRGSEAPLLPTLPPPAPPERARGAGGQFCRRLPPFQETPAGAFAGTQPRMPALASVPRAAWPPSGSLSRASCRGCAGQCRPQGWLETLKDDGCRGQPPPRSGPSPRPSCCLAIGDGREPLGVSLPSRPFSVVRPGQGAAGCAVAGTGPLLRTSHLPGVEAGRLRAADGFLRLPPARAHPRPQRPRGGLCSFPRFQLGNVEK